MKVTNNFFYWLLIAILLGFATFFTYRVNSFKKSLTEVSEEIVLESGAEVDFFKAVDGDEIAVSLENENFVVRILGIKSFDPTVNDPQVAGIAQQSLAFLSNQLQGKKLILTFETFLKDSKQRVLAYVEVDGQDIGFEMVKKGMSIVYNRYPFSKMEPYLAEENQAREAKTGLWGHELTATRAEQLKILWEQQREND